MRSVLFNTWALFFGFAIIFLAHGLQGTLIGVRAKIEGFSYRYAKELVHEIWTIANDLGYKEFVWQLSSPIYDDHMYYYLGTKVPSIDIIDFDFPQWHTIDDTIENCSPKGLHIVGNVLLQFIYNKDKK